MSKYDVINDSLNKIPTEILDEFCVKQNMTIRDFVSKVYINNISDNVTVDHIVNFIANKFYPAIKKQNEEVKIQALNEFTGSFDFKRIINDNFDVYNYLKDNMVYDGNEYRIKVSNRTVEDAYNNIVNNNNEIEDLNSRKETCEYYLNLFCNDEKILNSIMNVNNMKLKDYVLEELPKQMTSSDGVSMNGVFYKIDEIISYAVSHQIEKIESIENENNKISDTPNNVDQIIVEEKEDGSLLVTSELNLEAIREPNDKEIDNYINVEKSTLSNVETNLLRRFNNFQDAIRTCNSEEKLKQMEEDYSNLLLEYEDSIDNRFLSSFASKNRDSLNEQQRLIIKIEGNKEYSIDSMEGQIVSLRNRLSNAYSIDELSEINYLINVMIRETIKEDINDPQLKSDLERLKYKYDKKFLAFDSSIEYDNKEAFRCNSEIDFLVTNVKKTKEAYENSIDAREKAALEVRLNITYQNAIKEIMRSSDIITQKVSDYYLDKLNNIIEEKEEYRRAA